MQQDNVFVFLFFASPSWSEQSSQAYISSEQDWSQDWTGTVKLVLSGAVRISGQSVTFWFKSRLGIFVV